MCISSFTYALFKVFTLSYETVFRKKKICFCKQVITMPIKKLKFGCISKIENNAYKLKI